MSAFKIAASQRRVVGKLQNLSAKLGLKSRDLQDLIQVALRTSRVPKKEGGYTSIFKYERKIAERKFDPFADEDVVPMEYLAIIKGTNLFFSIE